MQDVRDIQTDSNSVSCVIRCMETVRKGQLHSPKTVVRTGFARLPCLEGLLFPVL